MIPLFCFPSPSCPGAADPGETEKSKAPVWKANWRAMAETGRAAAAGGPEEGSCGGEEEAEAPGGGGKLPGPSSHCSSFHTAWCSRATEWPVQVWDVREFTIEPSPWCLNLPSLGSKTQSIESSPGLRMKRLNHSTQVLICSGSLNKPFGLSGYLLDLFISEVRGWTWQSPEPVPDLTLSDFETQRGWWIEAWWRSLREGLGKGKWGQRVSWPSYSQQTVCFQIQTC